MHRIIPIEAFNDNYLWLFHAEGDQRACVVDPGDATPVLEYLDRHGLTLTDILVTHHHADHTGGIDTLLSHYPVPVHGPASSRIPQITHPLEEGDEATILGLGFRVLAVPGHTLDHIAYFHAGDGGQAPLLFCGDTLFVAGCGRIFEGDPEMMYRSLSKLAALPAETRVYCAHEYTLANLAFARAVLPGDPAFREREAAARAMRERGEPTVPSSIGAELEANPFLRCDDPELQQALRAHSPETESGGEPESVFAGIRQWKDHYRG